MRLLKKSYPYFYFPACLCLISALFLLACNSDYTDGVKTRLEVNEFRDLLSSSPEAQLIDVRTPEEFAGGHLYGALNIDFSTGDFKQRISQLPKDKPTFVYCLSGGRSSAAARELRELGYAPVYEMNGGMMKWRAANLPETTEALASSPGMSMDEYLSAIQIKKKIMVDFYADWCEPCRKMKPWIDELEGKYTDRLSILRINADKNKALCKDLEISALPVLKYYVDGEEVWSHTGYLSREEALDKLKLKND